jgi:hypothetical protein
MSKNNEEMLSASCEQARMFMPPNRDELIISLIKLKYVLKQFLLIFYSIYNKNQYRNTEKSIFVLLLSEFSID